MRAQHARRGLTRAQPVILARVSSGNAERPNSGARGLGARASALWAQRPRVRTQRARSARLRWQRPAALGARLAAACQQSPPSRLPRSVPGAASEDGSPSAERCGRRRRCHHCAVRCTAKGTQEGLAHVAAGIPTRPCALLPRPPDLAGTTGTPLRRAPRWRFPRSGRTAQKSLAWCMVSATGALTRRAGAPDNPKVCCRVATARARGWGAALTRFVQVPHLR